MANVIRWTIGPVRHSGFNCLKLSIDLWRRLYKDTFQYYVCYNNINDKQIAELNSLGVNLVDQNLHKNSLKYKPKSTAWKLYPPRLQLDSHEIFIDNDLLVYKKAPWLEAYLASDDMFLVTSAHKRFYGIWDFLIPENFPNINTGFFALPPNYNLHRMIKNTFEMYPGKHWQTHYDEEGIMTALMMRKNLKIISMEDLFVNNSGMTDYRLGIYGTHFAGINSGNDDFFIRYVKEFNGKR